MVGLEAQIARVDVWAVEIPTDAHEQDGTLDWDATTMVVVRLHAGGKAGLGYTYGPAAAARLIVEKLGRVVCGADAGAPQTLQGALRDAVRNAGVRGIGALAISAVDVAAWDLKARLLGVSLAELLGRARGAVPIYGSGGFTSYSQAKLTEQLGGWVARGIPRVKMKVGRDAAVDVERVKAARAAIGEEAELFVDANGGYSAKVALACAEVFRREAGVSWFEEPRPQGDWEGLGWLRAHGPAGMEIAAGEYGYDLLDFRRLLEGRAVDVLQIDVTRCGGVTGFLAAAALADGFQIEYSAHCAPALHAHLGAALPNLRHIEYFHDHVRIEALLLDGVAVQREGEMVVGAEAGMGMTFKEQDAERYLVMRECIT